MRSPLFWYGRRLREPAHTKCGAGEAACGFGSRLSLERQVGGTAAVCRPVLMRIQDPLYYTTRAALKNKAFSLFKILSLHKWLPRQNVDKPFASFYVQRVCAVLGGVPEKEAIALGQIGDIGRPVLYLAVDTKLGYPFC